MNKPISVLLIGNPNCGKTTLFNSLTGSSGQVGNWSGVTVNVKTSNYHNAIISDMPGVYSLNDDLIKGCFDASSPDLILNVTDATNIVRGLSLTAELLKAGTEVVIVPNMIDEAVGTDFSMLERETGVKVIPVSAAHGIGMDKLKAYLDGFVPKLNAESRHELNVTRLIRKLSAGWDYAMSSSDRVDMFICRRITGIPLFLLIMPAVFQLSFGTVGSKMSELISYIIDYCRGLFTALPEPFNNFIAEGIIGGVGSVLEFLPQIAIFYTCMTVLEDSGLMTRLSFCFDSIFRRVGLNGKTVIPCILGFGCMVPAIMSVRALDTERDRTAALLILPFITCSARIPVYGLFLNNYVSSDIMRSIIIFIIYISSIAVAMMSALLFSKVVLKSKPSPYIEELPKYRIPLIRSMLTSSWFKIKGYIIKAGTVILSASVLMWWLNSIGFLGTLGRAAAPLFEPLGFGNEYAVTALLVGLSAKEAIISSFGIFGMTLEEIFPTFASASSYITFILFYTPCIVALRTFFVELKSVRLGITVVFYQLAIAYLLSLTVNLLFSAFI